MFLLRSHTYSAAAGLAWLTRDHNHVRLFIARYDFTQTCFIRLLDLQSRFYIVFVVFTDAGIWFSDFVYIEIICLRVRESIITKSL